MRKYKYLIWTYFGIFLLLTQGCKSSSNKNETLRNVILTENFIPGANETACWSGVVEEGSNVSAAFMAEGKISRTFVKEGDRIHAGQILARLDDADYRIGVAQLEAQFEQMTREKERMDAMFQRHNIAPNDYEKFSAGYEQLRLQLDMAKRRLDYTVLYAPTDGYIATKYLNEGELVGAGTPVFSITNDTQLIATIDLPVSAYNERDKIISATGSIPGLNADFNLSIISFTPESNNNMLYRMKLSIPAQVAKDLAPGMNISVKLQTEKDSENKTLIPSRAIFSENGKSYVWIFNETDSTISKKPVDIVGNAIGKMSTVCGLADQDVIVETGVKQLYEGEKVNPLNRNDLGL